MPLTVPRYAESLGVTTRCKLLCFDSQIPPEGVTVPHIKTGEPLRLPPLTVAQFLILSMIDFGEQIFGWQVRRPPRLMSKAIQNGNTAAWIQNAY